MGTLVAGNGPETGRRYALSVPASILGRHPECQVVIDVGAVSRQHARVTKDGERYFVEDLGSRNGTYVNGELLDASQRKELRHGDVVRVCDIEYTFEGDSTGTAPIAPFQSLSDNSSVLKAIMVDDPGGGSTIQGKFDVSSHYGKGASFSASAEARLNALLEITQSLGKALSLDAVLNQILSSLFKIFVQADRGFVVLESADGALVPRWTKTRRESQETIRISRTIIKAVMDSKVGLLSQDASSDHRFEMSQSLANFKIRSLMCAPLLDSEGRVIGALQIDTLDQRQRFDQKDLEVLVSVAITAGVAISNMQLLERAIQQREVQRDLRLAHDVQLSFLPQTRPSLPGYDFFAYYQSANRVGGDYYDYIALPDGRWAIIVADVVGHGIAAALLMAKLSGLASFCLAVNKDPAAAISDLNRRFNMLELGHFATLVLIVLDPRTNEGRLVNAGHMAPIVRGKSGDLVEPGEEEAGLPIGVMENWEYQAAPFHLDPGELAVLFTDGLNETMNAGDEEFGINRIRAIIKAGAESLEEMGKSIIRQVEAFSSDQKDDRCLVIIGRTT